MKWLVVLALGCGSGKPPGAGGATGSGCDGIRARVEQLYRAEATAREPRRVAEAVADNTEMVLKECARDPAKVSGCVAGIATIADLEHRCLAPLDEEGSEGDRLAR